MYSITFGNFDGKSVSFDGITEIRVGGDVSNLKPIAENEILSYVFAPNRIYQLIGEDFNIFFHYETDYISVGKTSD